MTIHNPPKSSKAQTLSSKAQTLSGCSVSVVIPMFNAGNYVNECLDSLLNQTFQDFEVIVVDDCSTDNSVAVVKSYEPKFGGRLQLDKTKTNSGGGGYVPRNVGLSLAKGDYIFFADADDFLAVNALETLYDAARGFGADVVYTGAYYDVQQPNDSSELKDGEGKALLKDGAEDKPVLTVKDPAKNLDRLLPEGNFRTPWARFVRRDFLTENGIVFPEITTGGDFIWTIHVHCLAKNFLRIPTPVYYHRNYNVDSVSRTKRSPQEQVSYWFSAFVAWTKAFQELMDKIDLLRDNPDYSYQAMRGHFGYCFSRIAEEKWQLDRRTIYETLYREFAKQKNSADFMSAFLFSSIVFYRKSLSQAKWNLGKLKDGFYPPEDDNPSEDDNQPEDKEDSAVTVQPAPVPHVTESTCAVSVIVPMFNAAEYIGECLESLLIQTFTDFEVIVVDDCSTDNSVEVVESYIPKFDGRLRLEKTEKNSEGGGYVPRNIGLELANGEYVFFMDSDDFIRGDALETLHSWAKENETDVVYTSAYYDIRQANDVYVLRDGEYRDLLKAKKKDEPTLTVDAPKVNLDILLTPSRQRHFRNLWTKFVRRDFLLNNNIVFPAIMTGGDFLWVINVYAHAKRLLRLPIPLYFYRHYNSDSVAWKNVEAPAQVTKTVSSFVDFIKALSELATADELLKDNPSYCYEVVRSYFNVCFGRLSAELNQSRPEKLYEILCDEFSKNNDELSSIMPFFVSNIVQREQSTSQAQEQFDKLTQEVNKLKPKR